MADSRPDYEIRKEEIRNDLVRNPITEPLYSRIRDQPAEPVNIMIDVNMQFYRGRESAFAEVIDIATEALSRKNITDLNDLQIPESVGSSANPYMSGRLPGFVIQEMIRLDAERARARTEAPRREEAGRIEAEAPARPEAPPIKIAPYTAIYRIWENFPVHPLIDRSIMTVKADAARRAFMAEGRNIVWAVIDSGVDNMHDHFKEAATLDVKLPSSISISPFPMAKAHSRRWSTNLATVRMWRASSLVVCLRPGNRMSRRSAPSAAAWIRSRTSWKTSRRWTASPEWRPFARSSA